MSTTTTTTAPVIPADAYRAFADYLAGGGTPCSPDEWFAGDAGKAALIEIGEREITATKAARVAAAVAIWRDLKANGQVTTYSGGHAATLLAYLKDLDLSALPAPAGK